VIRILNIRLLGGVSVCRLLQLFVMFDRIVRMKDHSERFERIFDHIFEGTSLVDALALEGMSAKLFYKGVNSTPELARSYAQAEQFRAEMYAKEIVEIADTEEDAAKARNRIQARQWLASKVLPKKYGDNLNINVEQKIDLIGALEEAKRRAALAMQPMCNLENVVDAEILTDTGLLTHETPDSVSVAVDSAQEIEAGKGGTGGGGA